MELRPFLEAPDLTDETETLPKEADLHEQVEKYKKS
jgi:hypothetical protein